MLTTRLDRAITDGTGHLPSRIRLADGAVISVHTGPGAHCTPQPQAPIGHPGPYTHLEVCLFTPLAVPEWAQFEDCGPSSKDRNGTAYNYVPAEMVRTLVAAHGGEQARQDKRDDVVTVRGGSCMPLHQLMQTLGNA